MRIGVPTEVKSEEFRVAATPAGVRELTAAGHQVLLQSGAGAGSRLPDEEYAAAGATLVAAADEVWEAADLVLKVKEPIAEEFPHLIRSLKIELLSVEPEPVLIRNICAGTDAQQHVVRFGVLTLQIVRVIGRDQP